MDLILQNSPLTVVDEEKCTGCGLCVKVCPSQTLSMIDGKARVSGEHSLRCGHCAAVCPENAVTVRTMDPGMDEYFSIPGAAGREGREGLPSPESLVALMRQRRSCRVFKEKPVGGEILEDLVKIGITAPTGTNCQPWFFVLLPDRSSVESLGRRVAAFYRSLNRISSMRFARGVSRFLPGDPLGMYYREFYETVREGLREYDEEGRDRLFHGAAACIMVGSEGWGSTPREDALLATQNIILAAESMGLGTCLVGLAVEAIRLDPRLSRRLNLRRGKKIHAVIALGHPGVSYKRAAGRRTPPIEWLEQV